MKKKLNRVAKSLQAGTVWKNCTQQAFLQVPWGGKKQSGVGRELGECGLNNFLDIKSVYLNEKGVSSGYLQQ